MSGWDTTPKPPSRETEVLIRRGRVASVDLYEIKDSELELLEKGSPAGLYLNFAIFLLSMAFSAIVAICTAASFVSPVAETLFLIVAVVGILGGVFLLILWMRTRASIRLIVAVIRQRIPPDQKALAEERIERPRE